MKIKSFYILILSWVLYDQFGTHEWNTNFVVIYYAVFYSFVLYWMYYLFSVLKIKFDKLSIVILAVPVFLRLVLELSSFGLDRSEYYERTSNTYIDFVTWMVLIVLFLIVLWARFIRSRRG